MYKKKALCSTLFTPPPSSHRNWFSLVPPRQNSHIQSIVLQKYIFTPSHLLHISNFCTMFSQYIQYIFTHVNKLIASSWYSQQGTEIIAKIALSITIELSPHRNCITYPSNLPKLYSTQFASFMATLIMASQQQL